MVAYQYNGLSDNQDKFLVLDPYINVILGIGNEQPLISTASEKILLTKATWTRNHILNLFHPVNRLAL